MGKMGGGGREEKPPQVSGRGQPTRTFSHRKPEPKLFGETNPVALQGSGQHLFRWRKGTEKKPSWTQNIRDLLQGERGRTRTQRARPARD